MHSLYTSAELRIIEQSALARLPEGTLMGRAGKAGADCARTLIAKDLRGARILVLAGPGNNGGDALVTACLLADAGAQVHIFGLWEEGSVRPADAQRALEKCRSSAVRFVPLSQIDLSTSADWDLVIDGIFGIGLKRALAEPICRVIHEVNKLSCPVLALDVPTGLDPDTGNLVDDGGCAIVASATITFIGDKPGLHTAHGRDFAGDVHVADLGLDSSDLIKSQLHLSSVKTFQKVLRRRKHGSHKGTYGDVIVLGGAAGMAGAPILSARAAAFCGAGRVIAALLERPAAYDSQHPELMLRAASEIELGSGIIVAGPGMGAQSPDMLERALRSPHPVVLDADALNMIAASTSLQAEVAARRADTIMTPHPLEAARLLGVKTTAIQADRIGAAREIARQYHCVALLKGSGTVIADADGNAVINPTGNPALATAGSGDVLAGICGALLAQSISGWHAAVAAAWLHGRAADELVAEGIGPIGLTASELIPRVRKILNQVTALSAAD